MFKMWRFAIFILGILLFTFYIWPTPYSRYTYQGMTVMSNSFTGCQKIITPVGEKSLGGDGRCFLRYEQKTPSTLAIVADESLTHPDDSTLLVDESLKQQGVADQTALRQVNVVNRLDISLTLYGEGPKLRIANNSNCDIWSLELGIRRRPGDEVIGYEVDTGSLKPHEVFEEYISLANSLPAPMISVKSIIFHDNSGSNELDSPCSL